MGAYLKRFTERWVGLTREVWLGAITLVLLAIAVKAGYLSGGDAELARWMEVMRSPNLDAIARALTFFGSFSWTFVVAVVMSLWWFRMRQRKMLEIFWFAWLCGFVLQFFLRYCIAQWRPDSGVVEGPISLATAYNLAGFTSGHAFRSAFLFGWWAEWLAQRRTTLATLLLVVCNILIVSVGWTRIYLNRHWATDVVGAWIIAALMLSIAGPWLKKYRQTQKSKAT